MASVLRKLHKVNSAVKISAVLLEQERTIVLTPPISDTTLEILIPFPWQ
jgi:hypothetical protein